MVENELHDPIRSEVRNVFLVAHVMAGGSEHERLHRIPQCVNRVVIGIDWRVRPVVELVFWINVRVEFFQQSLDTGMNHKMVWLHILNTLWDAVFALASTYDVWHTIYTGQLWYEPLLGAISRYLQAVAFVLSNSLSNLLCQHSLLVELIVDIHDTVLLIDCHELACCRVVFETEVKANGFW